MSEGTQCSLLPSSSSPSRLPPPLGSPLSSNRPGAGEPGLTISLTILYTSGAEQWRTTTKNSGNRGTALLLLTPGGSCMPEPSIHIGLLRLAGARETHWARAEAEGGKQLACNDRDELEAPLLSFLNDTVFSALIKGHLMNNLGALEGALESIKRCPLPVFFLSVRVCVFAGVRCCDPAERRTELSRRP